MKTTEKTIGRLKTLKGFLAISGLLLFYLTTQAMASTTLPGNNASLMKIADTSVSAALQAQLATHQNDLYFPFSVERFYKQSGFKPVWIAPDTVKTHASEAMLLLDCVLQYGLAYDDYHPKDLLYDKLTLMIARGNKVSAGDKARFDILLTDAMITFMNNLHYGKMNPDYPNVKIDAGIATSFKAEAALQQAISHENFIRDVEAAQPRSKEYLNMQDHMRQLTGHYQLDCYEVPQKDIVKMAINLERLRWINSYDKIYIEINIPAYSLAFYQPDTVYQFKVVVGKPVSPTPTLQSAVAYFTTAPDWKVPQSIFIKEILPKATKDASYLENSHFAIFDLRGNYLEANKANLARIKQNPRRYSARQSSGCDNSLGLIVFRFPNVYDIYLHDTPEQSLFANEIRDLSHGCIRVEHAEKLAGLLLTNDGAANKLPAMRQALGAYQTLTFTLKKAVPIKITYLTCAVTEGTLIRYSDIYNLDKSLEIALYNTLPPLSMNR